MFHIPVSDLTDNKEIVRLMMDIFQLAVEYSINRLENVSIQYLELKISKNNVLDAYFYADKMKYGPLITIYFGIFIDIYK